jgi:hypothetical protein
MISGAQPFAAPTIKEIRRRHSQAHPAPLASRIKGLPFGYDAVFIKLTFKEPLLRYRSAAAMLDDLDRLENGDTPLAERELRKSRSH